MCVIYITVKALSNRKCIYISIFCIKTLLSLNSINLPTVLNDEMLQRTEATNILNLTRKYKCILVVVIFQILLQILKPYWDVGLLCFLCSTETTPTWNVELKPQQISCIPFLNNPSEYAKRTPTASKFKLYHQESNGFRVRSICYIFHKSKGRPLLYVL